LDDALDWLRHAVGEDTATAGGGVTASVCEHEISGAFVASARREIDRE